MAALGDVFLANICARVGVRAYVCSAHEEGKVYQIEMKVNRGGLETNVDKQWEYFVGIHEGHLWPSVLRRINVTSTTAKCYVPCCMR